MPRPRYCRPPATIRVKGHWRTLKRRRKKRAQSAPRGRYFVVKNTRTGHTCGHHHRTFTAAVSCRKRKDRGERAFRARHRGRRDTFIVDTRNK